jgi:dTMP kinase
MVLQNFIVLEGIDGAGTTTQLNALRSRPETGNFLFTAEPTTAATGKFLRQMLKGDLPLNPVTSAYLFAADRNEHINGTLVTQDDRTLVTGVAQACKNNKVVVSDRYFFSSLAYQSIDCGQTLPALLNSPFPLPQLLFFFNIEPEVSLKRITVRGYTEIYEKLDFLKKTEAAYRRIIDEYSDAGKCETMKIVTIDATKGKDEISQIIWKEIQNLPIFKV